VKRIVEKKNDAQNFTKVNFQSDIGEEKKGEWEQGGSAGDRSVVVKLAQNGRVLFNPFIQNMMSGAKNLPGGIAGMVFKGLPNHLTKFPIRLVSGVESGLNIVP